MPQVSLLLDCLDPAAVDQAAVVMVSKELQRLLHQGIGQGHDFIPQHIVQTPLLAHYYGIDRMVIEVATGSNIPVSTAPHGPLISAKPHGNGPVFPAALPSSWHPPQPVRCGWPAVLPTTRLCPPSALSQRDDSIENFQPRSHGPLSVIFMRPSSFLANHRINERR